MNLERANEIESEWNALKTTAEKRAWLSSLSTDDLTGFVTYMIANSADREIPGIIKRFKAAWGIA